MNKSFKLIIFVIFISFYMIINSALAQNSSLLFSDNELEHSLLSLRQSYQELKVKNDDIKLEILKLKSEIIELNLKKQQYVSKKESFTSNSNQELQDIKLKAEEMATIENGVEKLYKEIALVKKDNADLQNKVDIIEGQENKFSGVINKLTDDLNVLEKKKNSIDTVLSQQQLSNNSPSSERALQLVNMEIKELESQFNKKQRKISRPLTDYSDLKRENNILKQKNSIFEDEIKILEEKRMALDLKIVNYSKNFEAQISSLNEDIEKLIKEKQNLENVLEKSEAKIAQYTINLDSMEQEQLRLEENLLIIKKEHDNLNEEIVFLEKTLKEIE